MFKSSKLWRGKRVANQHVYAPLAGGLLILFSIFGTGCPDIAQPDDDQQNKLNQDQHLEQQYAKDPASDLSPLTAHASVDQNLVIGLAANLAGSASGGQPPYGYEWKQLDGPGQTLTNPGAATATVTGLALGTTTYRLTVTDSAGATATDDAIVRVVPIPVPPDVLAVKSDAGGANDGTSWTNAFTSLQGALNAARASNGAVRQIWVAKGTYKPAGPNGDRTASFRLVPRVAVYGGFGGYELELNQRNASTNVTTLSGDLNSDDSTSFDFVNYGDNSYTIITAQDLDATALLDGFTITGANSAGNGGGLILDFASLGISHCTFVANLAGTIDGKGAGIYMINGSRPAISSCDFRFNRTIFGGALYADASSPAVTDTTFRMNAANRGGAVFATTGSPVNFERCEFFNNRADFGAALLNRADGVKVNHCVFKNNLVNLSGGAICSSGPNLSIINSEFRSNTAFDTGGAVFSGAETLKMVNCIVCDNSGDTAAGIYSAGDRSNITNCTIANNMGRTSATGIMDPAGKTVVFNCILAFNSGDTRTFSIQAIQINTGSSTIYPNVYYSDVQGFSSGGSNIGADPLFVKLAEGDYHLLPGSPCINRGSSSVALAGIDTDVEGKARVRGAPPVVDMGAYEY